MELATHDLAALGAGDLIRVSATIPRAAPRTFALLTACLVFPLSFAVLAHSLFTHPILLRLKNSDYHSADAAQWVALFGYQFLYLIFLFTFSLLSTAAAVFTVASLYAAKPASTASSLSALPTILPRLLRTFLWVSLLMFAYNAVFVITLVFLIILFVPSPSTPPSLSFVLILLAIVLVFLAVHVYISAIWHLASVISVLEPICGLAAMIKSRQLLQGRTRTAAVLVVSYFAACGVTAGLFHSAVVKGRGEEGSLGLTLPVKILVGAVMVSVLVIVNLLGLLVQSVFYYACKAFHNQQIDRTQLYEHLGGYLGEYVPLKSNIQMENL